MSTKLARIRFHGEELEFTAEVRYLVADEAATRSLGRSPMRRSVSTEAPIPKRLLAEVLDAFATAGRPEEAYVWLVTPLEELDGQRPIESLRVRRGPQVLELVRAHLS